MTTIHSIPHDVLALLDDILHEADQQIDYLHDKFQATGSGTAVRAKIEHVRAMLAHACKSPAQPSEQADGMSESTNGGMHAAIFAKVWGDAGGGDAGRVALANYAYALGQKSRDDLSDAKVCFIDQWNCTHSLTLQGAANELKALHDAWPGGLEEIESALRTARNQTPEGASPDTGSNG